MKKPSSPPSLLQQAGQDADPAARVWRHEVGQLAGLGGSMPKSGCACEEAGDDFFALLRLERADRIDQRPAGLEPVGGAVEQPALAARRSRR